MRNGTVNNDDVDLEDIKIRWDQGHDFLEKIQAYREGTDFKNIGDDYSNFLETKISSRVVRRNVSRDTLKPSKKLDRDVLVRIATRDAGTLRTDDVNSKEHGRLVIMCGKGGAGKSYTVDSVLSTLRNEYNFTEETYLILATSAMAATVISGVTVHSSEYGLVIPLENKYVEVKGRELRKYQKRLKNLKF